MWWVIAFLGLFVFWALRFGYQHKKPPRQSQNVATPASDSGQYTIRDGKSVKTDAVFDAWVSGDLDAMVKVMGEKSHPIDRHHLLNCIVEAAYRRREDSAMLDLCVSTSETYLSEAPKLMRALLSDMPGQLPRIPVYQLYATILTQKGQFDRAIQVCELAIQSELQDGTKGGFYGRIERIKRAKQKQIAGPS